MLIQDSGNLDLRFRLRGDRPLSVRIHVLTCYDSECLAEVERISPPALKRSLVIDSERFPLYLDSDGMWRRVFSSIPALEDFLGRPLHLGAINFFGTQSLLIHESIQDLWAHYKDHDLILIEKPFILLSRPKNSELSSAKANLKGSGSSNKVGKEALDSSTGSSFGASPRVRTPLGQMSLAEGLAQILNQDLGPHIILQSSQLVSSLYVVAAAGVSLFVFFSLPNAASFVLLIWLCTFWSALSIWLFDSFSIWIPTLAPIVSMIAAYVLFLGYKNLTLQKTQLELHREKKSARELEKLKNNFVSLISHDLRTPLAKIQNAIDHLQFHPLKKELDSELRMLSESSHELQKYISSILQLLRIESRDFQLHKSSSDLNEEVTRVIEQIKPLATSKDILIETDFEPLFNLEADWVLLHEVILNLLDNAIKYSPAGSKIKLETRDKGESVIVRVQDSGVGVSSDELSKVWEQFVRGSGKGKTTGEGLGLYLVRYFVELHGGSVRMHSQPGRGTLVEVEIPLPPSAGSKSPEDLHSTLSEVSDFGGRVSPKDIGNTL